MLCSACRPAGHVDADERLRMVGADRRSRCSRCSRGHSRDARRHADCNVYTSVASMHVTIVKTFTKLYDYATENGRKNDIRRYLKLKNEPLSTFPDSL